MTVLLMPLVFCRETMYVFQVKTTLLQCSGALLLPLLGWVWFWDASTRLPLRDPLVLLLALSMAWMAFKAFDSIEPTLSLRQAGQWLWWFLFALAVPSFFTTARSRRVLLGGLCFAGVLAIAVALAISRPGAREFLFGAHADDHRERFVDMAAVPVLGDLCRWLFFPAPFVDVLDSKERLKQRSGEAVLKLSRASFYPGKPQAGTFGNKNFLAAHLNLIAPLLLWASLRCLRAARSRRKRRFVHLFLAVALGLAFWAALSLIFDIGSRGAWLGGAASLLFGAFFGLVKICPKGLRRVAFVVVLLLSAFVVGALFQSKPERLASIFDSSHGTNELRRLIWAHSIKGWWQDDRWSGFEGPWQRRLTGLGLGSFRVFYPKYRSERCFVIEHGQHNSETRHPHSAYVALLLEQGFVGLGLALAFMVFFLLRIVRSIVVPGIHDRSLLLVLACALLSLWVHQGVSICGRQDAIGFQLWLTLGLALAVLGPRKREGAVGVRPWLPSFKVFFVVACALGAPVLVACVTPSPLAHFRAQHDYEMGHIYYGVVRRGQMELEQLLRRFDMPKRGAASGLPSEELRRGALRVSSQRDKVEFYRKLACRYFLEAQRLDPALVEARYIMANMELQLGRFALGEGRYEEAGVHLGRAHGAYAKIGEARPYFVQLSYFQGVALMGLGRVQFQNADLAQQHYRLATQSFGRYERQDPCFEPLFFDWATALFQLGEKKQARACLYKILANKGRGHHPLFDESSVADARRILKRLLEGADPKERFLLIRLLARSVSHHSSTCLLPFLPKTDRHFKNGLLLGYKHHVRMR